MPRVRDKVMSSGKKMYEHDSCRAVIFLKKV